MPGGVLRLLIPWFVLPVLASPFAVLLIEQGAGARVGFDRTAFRFVCQAMLAGMLQFWAIATLAGALVMAIASRRKGSRPGSPQTS